LGAAPGVPPIDDDGEPSAMRIAATTAAVLLGLVLLDGPPLSALGPAAGFAAPGVFRGSLPPLALRTPP